MLRIKSIATLLCLTLIVSCDKPKVVNKEKIFSTFKPEDAPYRDKLAENLLKYPDDIRYTFEKYIDDKNIEVVVTGNDFVANCLVHVNDWQGMEDIKKVKGAGYRHAELERFLLGIYSKPEGAVFVYKSIGSITD